MNLLFICTGNTCRSPMAEGIAKTILGQTATSCGLAAMEGAPAADHAIAVAKEHGIDLTAHRATPLTESALNEADRIYVMSQSHADALTRFRPELADKIRVMGISDPFGGSLDTYRQCFNEILAYLEDEPWN